MYTQAQGPQAQECECTYQANHKGTQIHLICAMQANSPVVINYLFHYETDLLIFYIDQLVKFNCGMAKLCYDYVCEHKWENPNSILENSICDFSIKLLYCFTECLQHL